MMEVRRGPLKALVRCCFVLRDNLRVSCEERIGQFVEQPSLRAVIIESIEVEEAHRRQGHCRRFIESTTQKTRSEIVIIEAVQNKDLAAALLRWGWDCDPGVMDFYWRPHDTSTTD